MPEVTYVQPNGQKTTVNLNVGTSLMHGAVANGIDGILGECGGGAMCATCHVYVENHADMLPKPSDDEDVLLDGTACDRLSNSRLGCQVVLSAELDGLVVRIPESQV